MSIFLFFIFKVKKNIIAAKVANAIKKKDLLSMRR